MGFKLSRIDVLSEKLIEFVAREASKIRYDKQKLQVIIGPSMSKIAIETIKAIGHDVVKEKNGLLYCMLCRKGPYTKRGMYLHLIRVHRYDLKLLISEELKDRISKASNY